MSFGSRVRARREELGMKQKDLAERLGITQGAVGNYETGVSSPKEEIMLKMFDVLEVEPNYLFQDSFDQKKEPPVENNRGEEDSEGYENRLHVLTRAFVKCGFMEEGGDISDSDLALIKGVLTILDAHFCDRDGGAC